MLVLIIAILISLAHAPWQEFQQVGGEDGEDPPLMIDFMEQECKKHAKNFPLPPVV